MSVSITFTQTSQRGLFHLDDPTDWLKCSSYKILSFRELLKQIIGAVVNTPLTSLSICNRYVFMSTDLSKEWYVRINETSLVIPSLLPFSV